MSMHLVARARKTALALVSSSLLLGASLSHAAFSQMVSFGDSLSDVGNVFLASGGTNPPAPYVGGQFSNGDTWNEYLATSLGIAAPTPSVTGGTGNAFGGARTLVTGASPSVQDQVNGYLAANSGSADPNAIYTLWMGGNDVNYAVATNDFGAVNVAANGVAALAQQLINAGAQSLLVVNLPNIGITPLGQNSGNPAGATFLSSSFNATMAAALAGVTGGNIEILDAFAITTNVVANPAAFGLTNVVDPCFDGVATVCANPNEYLFWDELHPTTYAHSLVAAEALPLANNLMAAAIPVPAAAWLFGTAMIGLAGARAKRAAA